MEEGDRSMRFKPLPKSPMGLSDYLADLKDEKKAHLNQIRTLNKEITKVEGKFIEVLQAQGQDQVRGRRSRSSLVTKTHYNISNWNKLVSWIRETGHFEVFHARVSQNAINELADVGEKVPGVKSYKEISVSTSSFKEGKK
jgi:hypothetical protein